MSINPILADSAINQRHRFYSDRHSNSNIPTIDEIKRRLANKPYSKAIIKLREIDNIAEPRKKLRLMVEVNDAILESVNEFWKNLDIDEEQLVIATDQMILIYLYIVTRSKIAELFAHLSFIKAFVSPYVRQSNLGFILATYEHALYTLLERDKDELKSSDKKKMSRLIDMSIESEQPLRDTFAMNSPLRMTIIPEAMNASCYSPFEEMEDNVSFVEE
jgi:urate oxidase